MKRMLVSVAVVFFECLATGAAQPGMQTPTLPTVDQVIEKYVTAVGGRAALEKLTSVRTQGTIEISDFQITGTIEIVQKAPDKMLQTANLSGIGLQREGFDGTIGWSEEPQSGLRQKAGAELADAKRGALFPRELKLKQQYPTMTVTGRERVGERDTIVISRHRPKAPRRNCTSMRPPGCSCASRDPGMARRADCHRGHARRLPRRRRGEAGAPHPAEQSAVRRHRQGDEHQAQRVRRRRDFQEARTVLRHGGHGEERRPRRGPGPGDPIALQPALDHGCRPAPAYFMLSIPSMLSVSQDTGLNDERSPRSASVWRAGGRCSSSTSSCVAPGGAFRPAGPWPPDRA